MSNFAKLYVVPGIGQVLIQKKEHEETDAPSLEIRIPDAEGCELRQTIAYVTQRGRDEIFDRLLARDAEGLVQPLLEIRDNLLREILPEGSESPP